MSFLASRLHKYSTQLNVLKYISIAVLLGSVVYAAVIVRQIRMDSAKDELNDSVWASHMDFPESLQNIHLVIALCAAVGAVGMYAQRIVGVVLAVSAYGGAMGAYLWWYQVSKDFFNGVELLYFPPEIDHLGPLKDAIWWDLVGFIAIGLMLAWLLRMLLGIWIKSKLSAV